MLSRARSGASGRTRRRMRTRPRALARAAHARFDPNVDPALRFGVKNLGGNPAVATSLLPTFGPSALFGGTSGGVSGATFGDVFSRERAASLTQFREAALVRDQIRAEGGSRRSRSRHRREG